MAKRRRKRKGKQKKVSEVLPKCWSKKVYTTEYLANHHARRINFRKLPNYDTLYSYKCDHCDGWHLSRIHPEEYVKP